jgi:hypothetical protein
VPSILSAQARPAESGVLRQSRLDDRTAPLPSPGEFFVVLNDSSKRRDFGGRNMLYCGNTLLLLGNKLRSLWSLMLRQCTEHFTIFKELDTSYACVSELRQRR